MKKFFLLSLLFLSFGFDAFAQILGTNKILTYNNYLINTTDLTVYDTLPTYRNYLTNTLLDNKLYIADSNHIDIYTLDSSGLTLYKTFLLTTKPLNAPKILGFRTKSGHKLLTCYPGQADTMFILRLANDTIKDTLKFKQNLYFSLIFPVTDTSAYFILADSQKIGQVYILKLRYILMGANSIIKDSTISYDLGQQDSLFAIKRLAISPLGNYIALLTNSPYAFLLQTPINNPNNVSIANPFLANGYNLSFSPDEHIIYIANPNFILRFNLTTKTKDTIFLPGKAPTTLQLLPNASMLISFAPPRQNKIGQILNPDCDTLDYLMLDTQAITLNSQLPGYFQHTPPVPWFNFKIQPVQGTKTTFIFYPDTNYLNLRTITPEPDKIYWYVNDNLQDSTFLGQNLYKHTFYKKGIYKITARIFYGDSLQQYIVKFLHNPNNLYPDLIPDTLLVWCDTPSYQVNFTKFAEHSDSIVWFLNKVKYEKLYNISNTTLTRPGDYYVFVYNVDTTLADTIKLRYISKKFTADDIDLIVNDHVNKPDDNLYCTDNGVINFRLRMPRYEDCLFTYTVTWYFGDGSYSTTPYTFVSHRYLSPGTYPLRIIIVNDQTKAAYTITTSITVSIDPIEQAPLFDNLTRMEPAELKIGRDIKLADYQWQTNNMFVIQPDTMITDSATFTIPITDTVYQQTYSTITLFASMANNYAQSLKITVQNDSGLQIHVLDYNPKPDELPIFLGLPKIYKPNLNGWTCPESYYYFAWNDNFTLTFRNLQAISYISSDIITQNKYYMQDNATLYYPHYWLAPTNLQPSQWLNPLNDYPLGKNLQVKFKIDTSIIGDTTHLSIKKIGILAINRYTIPSTYSFAWETNAKFLIKKDSLVMVGSDYAGKYYLNFYVTDRVGCQYSRSIDLYVIDSIKAILPQAFTPNGDGYNDTWDLRRAFFEQLTATPPVPVYVKIWDKNGKIVKTFLVNENPMWDGTDNNGKLLPPGVYWYLVIVANKQYLKGTVTIIY